MNARRISTIVSATVLGLALSAGGGGMTPTAGAATIPTGISGAPAPSGGTSGDDGKAPTSAEPKSDNPVPGKTAASPKRKHTKTSRVSRRVQRHHRVGTAVHRRSHKASGTTGAAAPASAPTGTTGAPMAG
ncbi:MAG TPA: hypothetical protein VHV82_18370 [Sporichthyaceae bacterium]|jgi:hypothetical protein|nr:hypothetical protein [Sporichthyaceae bacterium]